MKILGISAFYHDSAAVLIIDGQIISAVQEERFSRKKHDFGFPRKAIAYCLESAGLKVSDLDFVVFYEKPFIKFERILETYLSYAPRGLASFIKALPLWIKQKIWMKEHIKEELGYQGKILFSEHHLSHAASAFFPSPFKSAAILTLDGVGEWTTTSFGVGSGNRIQLLKEIKFPHSLGLLYSAFTYFTGFKVNSAEYKVMGLAPYGRPIYKETILKELIDIKPDGSFKLNLDYFDYPVGLKMTTKKFEKIFGGPPRQPMAPLTQREMDLARSIQEVIEEVIFRMVRYIRKVTGQKKLCLAGGVALNCVANGKIWREKIFDEIWIQPASGDAGGALGAALIAWYQYLENQRITDEINDFMQGSYLGPEFSREEIKNYLNTNQIFAKELEIPDLIELVTDLVAQEKVIGWFWGRMEFGPRALGARSIIGDARSEKMQEILNLKIKFRESFRPFAPSILLEKVSDYFDFSGESPYMLLVAPVLEKWRYPLDNQGISKTGFDLLKIKRSVIPAVTHVDYSARLHTIKEKDHPVFYGLIKRFYEKYNCPLIINTSFNVRGEPIVCTPQDAYNCFMRTNMDYLVLGNFLLDKKQQRPLEKDIDWQKEFEID